MPNNNRPSLCGTLLISSLLGWMYGPTMAQIAQRWADTPEYSHGWLVPAFALWAAWSDCGRRPSFPLGWAAMAGFSLFVVGMTTIVASNEFDNAVMLATAGTVLSSCGAALSLIGSDHSVANSQGSVWGWLLMLTGALAYVGGAFLFIDWLAAAALIPVLGGLSLIWWPRTFRPSVWWSIPFLVFMIPLPFSVETGLREPLRKIATQVSSYVLETLGFACVTEGFVISIGESQIGVTEACSGLSMLMVFAALTFGCMMLVDRPLWYRAILGVSWPLIAVIANVFRIVTTGGLLAFGFEKLADITFHDLAGLAMMPVGLLLLWAEMWYLDHLVVLENEQRLGQLLAAVPKAE